MPLKVLKPTEYDSSSKTRASKRALAIAKYDLAWEKTPQQFDSSRTAYLQEQVKRTKSLFLHDVKGKTIVDLGCGDGAISRSSALAGADVIAADISKHALEGLEGIEGIKPEIHFIPFTTLPDSAFDYVIASNLIAELPHEEVRLFFSELARLVKREGKIIVSTSLDTSTEEALDLFLHFAQIELQIETIVLSYHRLYLRILPILPSFLRKSKKFLLFFEKLSKLIYDKEGASHAILLAKLKPLFNH